MKKRFYLPTTRSMQVCIFGKYDSVVMMGPSLHVYQNINQNYKQGQEILKMKYIKATNKIKIKQQQLLHLSWFYKFWADLFPNSVF